MLPLLLLCLTDYASLHVAASSLPALLLHNTEQSPPPLPLNGTEPSELLVANSSAASSQIELSTLSPTNQGANDLNPVPIAFDCHIQQNTRIRINEQSTYMSLLRAMITLSIKDFTSTYDGGTFSFQDYCNVQIVLWSAYAHAAPLQYRYAIYGLSEAMKRISICCNGGCVARYQ